MSPSLLTSLRPALLQEQHRRRLGRGDDAWGVVTAPGAWPRRFSSKRALLAVKTGMGSSKERTEVFPKKCR